MSITSSLPAGVTLTQGPGNLETLNVDTTLCRASILPYGAHLCTWQPQGSAPVIWMSRSSLFEAGKPVRGGVPICFPWFGPVPEGVAGGAPHGFARLRTWTLDAVEARPGGEVAVSLSLVADAATRALWPHEFAASFDVTFGRTLTMALTVRNTGASAFTFQEALHTYFAVGDIREVGITGLAGCTYIDKVRGGERAVQGSGPLVFAGETDRPYLGTEAATVIDDRRGGRRIVVDKRGSRTTVVWNPWVAKAQAMPDFGDDEWPGMVCVEAANALDDTVRLAAGTSHRMEAIVRVEQS